MSAPLRQNFMKLIRYSFRGPTIIFCGSYCILRPAHTQKKFRDPKCLNFHQKSEGENRMMNSRYSENFDPKMCMKLLKEIENYCIAILSLKCERIMVIFSIKIN